MDLTNQSFRNWMQLMMVVIAPLGFCIGTLLCKLKIYTPTWLNILSLIGLLLCALYVDIIGYIFDMHVMWVKHMFNPDSSVILVGVDAIYYVAANLYMCVLYVFALRLLMHFYYDKNTTLLNQQINADVNNKKITKNSVQSASQPLSDRVYLGVSASTTKKMFINRRKLADHSAYFGTTGSGKTNTILSIVESCVVNGVPFVYLDIKGSTALRDGIQEYCAKHDMVFKCFSVVDESWHYNPLKHGGQTAITDKIINLRNWDNEYYKSQAINFIQSLVYFLQQRRIEISLLNIAKYMDSTKLRSLDIDDEKLLELRKKILTGLEKEHIKNLSTELDILIDSEIGHLLVNNDDCIDLYSSIRQGEAVYFLLQPLLFKNYTELLANAVLNDLKAVLSYGLKERFKELHVFIDEPFSVNITDSIKTLLAQARSTNSAIHLATQAPSDADQHAKKMLSVVSNNINHIYVHRLNNPDDAEFAAQLIGTKEGYEITMQVDRDASGLAAGTSKVVQEFKVHPEKIKNLPTGKSVIVNKNTQEYDIIDVRKSLIES